MPATFDLSAEKLPHYRGTNPRPADFDVYWQQALTDLAQQPAELELVPNKQFSTQIAECFDLWFTGVGGARVHAKFLRPRKRTGAAPALLEFHGYSWDSGDWFHKLGYVAEGFCVAALDCRGQGGLSEDNGTVRGMTLRGHFIRGVEDPDPRRLYYRQVFLDTVRLAQLVMNLAEVDASRVATMGWSQGGALALACASLEPRICRVVSIYPFLSDYQRVWEADLARHGYTELIDFLRTRDPRHERLNEIFTRLGYIDIQHLTARIRADVLMLTGLADMICPPSAQFAAFNKITSPKRAVFYPDFGHENLPGAHDLAFNHLHALTSLEA
ncbi:acetylxylan esterase [Oleiharenicola lentus]|uniref:acetylxylan esterase n=1 Tax=Oleiharenicola lentus TaxID=2508720 RepID=UPI003F672EAF